MAFLEIDHLSLRLPGKAERPLLDEVSLQVAAGEMVGLVGESGSGKSVTARSVLGLWPDGAQCEGEVRVGGCDVLTASTERLLGLRRSEVSMVFQDPTTSLNPAFRVGSQIAEVLRAKQGLSRKQAWSRAVDLIDRVGIPRPAERAHAYPHELSGGMAQRIAIARALSCNPALLIADEPTTALDVTVQQEILDLFRDLQGEFGMAILFVTHDLAVAADICDRISVMYAGEIVEMAGVDALFARPRHPYARGLLSAMPHAADRKPPLPTIRGSVPKPGAWPDGCRFSNRCDFRIAGCAARVPLTADPCRFRNKACDRADRPASCPRTGCSQQERLASSDALPAEKGASGTARKRRTTRAARRTVSR
jgi:peptide/nickel transport system permease protein